MPQLLHIAASPSGASSHSRAAADALVDAWRRLHPSGRVETVDLWALELPEFDATMIAAKFAVLRSQDATDAQRAQWARAVRLSSQFNAADAHVLSLPMWNYGVPYRLKHYIDIVTLPGENWTWSRATGYQPLLRDRRAVLVYSSANDFAPGVERQYEDYQAPFMRQWLRFVGIDLVGEVAVAPTLTDPAHLAQVRADAAERARGLAARL